MKLTQFDLNPFYEENAEDLYVRFGAACDSSFMYAYSSNLSGMVEQLQAFSHLKDKDLVSA